MKKALALSLALLLIFGVIGCTSETAAPDPEPDQEVETVPTPEAEAPKDFASTIQWDAEYDVVVAGYGGAGATAAITAADEGAKVLLTEKAPEGQEGGNTKYSGQGVMGTDDADALYKYVQGMRGLFTNTLSDEMCRVFADGAFENRQWLIDLGADPEKLDNAFGAGTPWVWNEYPELEGADHCICYMVSGRNFDGAFYYLLQDNVEMRRDKIDIWYDSPAVHLIQDPETKTILGVQINKNGTMVNVRAKNGVVLATGGFEANMEMMANYLQQPYAYVYAAPYNTGDGIVMAQEVGAKLWHMSNSAGFLWGFLPPDAERCLTVSPNLGILVGPNGTRFMNESTSNRHGRINIGGRWISMPVPLPTWYIMDDAQVSANQIIRSFSEGNKDEIEKGWIIKADTIEELAVACNVDPEALKATIDAWNTACEKGEDALYGRPADRMVPISTGPFYAMKLGPTMYNTQGGPQRNEKAEVLDLHGNPIPHLYSAGELGAMWPDMYNGGGNLAEASIFGRIAGKNAAAPKN
ncbi:MAG: FAD-binding protein [Christensenellales bacterium]|jgi:succinate dehydrogenase/fumarate reductase flavoprotein subunit